MKCVPHRLLGTCLVLIAPWFVLCAAEEKILVRLHPTTVRWGEVTVSETTRVEIAPTDGEWRDAKEGLHEGRTALGKEDKNEYRYALGLSFVERSRTEDIDKMRSSERQARAEVAPYGSLLLAANLDDGQPGWESFKKRLLEMAAQLSPAGYSQFLSEFERNAQSAGCDDSGNLTMIFCVSGEGQDERSGEVSCKRTKEESGVGRQENGSLRYRDPHPACAALQKALQYLPASEVLMTDLQVEETVEETLTLAVTEGSDRPQGQWPEAAKLHRGPPPEGATDFSSSSEVNGVSHYEQVRGPRKANRPPETGPYLLVADSAPAALPSQFAGSRSILTRWSLSTASRRLGIRPRLLGDEVLEVDLGLFPAATAAAPAVDEFKTSVAQALEKVSGLLDAGSVRTALVDNNAALGMDEVLTVTCLTNKRGEEEARYCLARACSPVLNPKEFCLALRGAMKD